MYRYRMGSKPRRYGWVVVLIIAGVLLLLIISQGGQKSSSGSIPSISQEDGSGGVGGTLLGLWGDLKAGASTLWQNLTGQTGAKKMDISLDDPQDPESDSASGSGMDTGTDIGGDVQVVSATQQPPEAFVPAGSSPQILIYHTHSYEAYSKQPNQDYTETAQWRTKDDGFNVAAVGEALAKEISGKYGIAVLHDETDNECSNLSTAYTRSLQTAQKDLTDNPGLKILIDLHRDAYSSGIDPHTVTINGVQAARVMIVIGTGEGQTGVGFAVKPDWQQNLKLAQAISDKLKAFSPQLTRGVDIKTGRYNQHLSTGAVLIEVGDNMNTLDEALATVPYLAQAIADVYNSMAFAGTASPSPTPSVSPSPSPSVSVSASATPSPSPAGPVQEVISIEPLQGTKKPD